jgi:hypothetical protein
LYLRKWYEKNPQARPLYVAYDLPLVDPEVVGIENTRAPSGPIMNRPGMPKTENWPWGETRSDPNLLIENAATESQAGPLPGWYAVSVNQNHRVAGDLEYLLEFEPVD